MSNTDAQTKAHNKALKERNSAIAESSNARKQFDQARVHREQLETQSRTGRSEDSEKSRHEIEQARQKEDAARRQWEERQSQTARAETTLQGHIQSIDDPEARRQAQIKADHEANATRLYCSNSESENHAQLEEQFNDSGRRLHEAEGRSGEYVPKQDIRHEYEEDDIQYKTTSEGTERRIHTSRMRLQNPDSVLNWRNTEIGGRHDTAVRKTDGTANGVTHDGDDAGHSIAVSFGADPATLSNVSRQNAKQNRAGGTWYNGEAEARNIARENPDKELYMEVRTVYDVDKYGEKRPLYREMVVYEKDGLVQGNAEARSNAFDPERDRVHYGGDKLAFANSPNFTNEKTKDVFGKGPQYEGAKELQRRASTKQDQPGTVHSLDEARKKRAESLNAQPPTRGQENTEAVKSSSSKQTKSKATEGNSAAFGQSKKTSDTTSKRKSRITSENTRRYQSHLKTSDTKNKTIK